jgi:hypothetical protein
MTTIFDGHLNHLYAKCYSQTEHLTADEIIVLFNAVIFKQYILKKHKWAWDQNLQAA